MHKNRLFQSIAIEHSTSLTSSHDLILFSDSQSPTTSLFPSPFVAIRLLRSCPHCSGLMESMLYNRKHKWPNLRTSPSENKESLFCSRVSKKLTELGLWIPNCHFYRSRCIGALQVILCGWSQRWGKVRDESGVTSRAWSWRASYVLIQGLIHAHVECLRENKPAFNRWESRCPVRQVTWLISGRNETRSWFPSFIPVLPSKSFLQRPGLVLYFLSR